MKQVFPIVMLIVAGCAASDDPADGGFFNGIAGLAGGGYDARIETRQAGLDASLARQDTLRAELAALSRQHSDLKTRIIAQRAALGAQGVRLSAGAEAEVRRVIETDPQTPDPAARAEALRRAIAEARALSDSLARLSG